MAPRFALFLLLPLIALLSACGGDGPLGDSSELDVGGLWRGTLELSSAPCSINPYGLRFNFVHSVTQDYEQVALLDQDNILYVGNIVGDDGFSVDAAGPQRQLTPRGFVCDLFYRMRYKSVNDSDDRTSKVSFTITQECVGDITCEMTYDGEGKRS